MSEKNCGCQTRQVQYDTGEWSRGLEVDLCERHRITHWLPGDACGACGSHNTGWEVEYGAWCGDCGRTDSDE